MNRKRIWAELDTAEVVIRIDDEYRDVFVHETCSTRQCCAILPSPACTRTRHLFPGSRLRHDETTRSFLGHRGTQDISCRVPKTPPATSTHVPSLTMTLIAYSVPTNGGVLLPTLLSKVVFSVLSNNCIPEAT